MRSRGPSSGELRRINAGLGSGDYGSPTRLVQLRLGSVDDGITVATAVVGDDRWEAGGPFVVESASYRPGLIGITSDRRWALLSHERGGNVAELAPVPPHDAPGLRLDGYATALLESPGRLGVLTRTGISIFDDETLELLVEHELPWGEVHAAMIAGRAALVFIEDDGAVARAWLRCFAI